MRSSCTGDDRLCQVIMLPVLKSRCCSNYIPNKANSVSVPLVANLRQFGYRLLSAPYELIFKEEMGGEAQRFFVSTSQVAVGTLVGALVTLAFSIIAARALGPDEFGSFSIMVTVSVILAVLMGLSMAPMIKYASGAQNDAIRVRIISTSSVQIALLTAALTAIYVLLTPQLSRLFGISSALFLFSIAYAVISAFFALMMSPLRILSRMKVYALANAFQSVILLAVFLAFLSDDMRSWQVAAYSSYVSYAVIGLILVVYLRTYLRLQFDRFWAKKIINYSLFAAPGAFAAAFLGVDRLLINAFTTTANVGIYNAYFLPSITVALMLWGIFNASFFPYASKSSDREALFRKINRAVPYLAVSLVPSIVFLEFVAFIFYGSRYPFSWEIAFFFAIAAVIVVVDESYASLAGSVGTSGAKVVTISSVLALAVLISVDVVLIPLIGISGAALTLIFANLAPTAYLYSKRSILVRS